MTLGDILNSLDEADDDLCIVARRPWSANADAMLISLGDRHGVPANVTELGYEYFLEVHITKEEVLGESAALLTASQRFAVVLHYAENDAWPTWFHELCTPNNSGA